MRRCSIVLPEGPPAAPGGTPRDTPGGLQRAPHMCNVCRACVPYERACARVCERERRECCAHARCVHTCAWARSGGPPEGLGPPDLLEALLSNIAYLHRGVRAFMYLTSQVLRSGCEPTKNVATTRPGSGSGGKCKESEYGRAQVKVSMDPGTWNPGAHPQRLRTLPKTWPELYATGVGVVFNRCGSGLQSVFGECGSILHTGFTPSPHRLHTTPTSIAQLGWCGHPTVLPPTAYRVCAAVQHRGAVPLRGLAPHCLIAVPRLARPGTTAYRLQRPRGML
jgi:hypothetical protein